MVITLSAEVQYSTVQYSTVQYSVIINDIDSDNGNYQYTTSTPPVHHQELTMVQTQYSRYHLWSAKSVYLSILQWNATEQLN